MTAVAGTAVEDNPAASALHCVLCGPGEAHPHEVGLTTMGCHMDLSHQLHLKVLQLPEEHPQRYNMTLRNCEESTDKCVAIRVLGLETDMI